MQTQGVIKEILHDLQVALKDDPEGLVFSYADEMNPMDLELVLSRQNTDKQTNEVGSEEASSELLKAVIKNKPVNQENLAPNFRCTLCQDRMYAVNRYYVEGIRPILILHHTGSFLDGRFKRDQSNRHIMGGSGEDDVFSRMFVAAGQNMKDFHFQEYLACHFNPERSTEESWNDRGAHCLNHVKDTIKTHKIQKIILTGPAAVLLLGQEKAEELAKSSLCMPLPLGSSESEIMALVIRSPSALLAIESKRVEAQKKQDSQSYDKYIGMEKEIKKTIVKSLKSFLDDSN